MLILGFQCWDESHDASAAIVRDGVLIAAAEEERFSRRRHDGGLPANAIRYCLRQAGATLNDVSFVAHPQKPFSTGRDSALADMDLDFAHRMQREGQLRGASLMEKRLVDMIRRTPFSMNRDLNPQVVSGMREMRETFGVLPPFRYFGHHESHAAAAFFTSGRDYGAVLTVDGRGGNYSTVLWHGGGTQLTRVEAQPFYNSLGRFYEECTDYLGFSARFGAGRTMALAAYGEPLRLRDRMKRLLDLPMGENWYRHAAEPSPAVLPFGRRRDQDVLGEPYSSFAAAAQEALDTAIFRVTRLALERVGNDLLCLGGGVALNCLTAGRLANDRLIGSTWTFPAAGDAGLAVGAALLGAAAVGELKPRETRSVYLGPGFGESSIAAAIENAEGIKAVRREDVVADTANMLAAGKVVAWFQGRMEFGPNALGNRSILADPRTTAMRDRINRIKGREPWLPCASSILEERAGDYFELRAPSPFMTYAFPVRPEMRSRIPAVVHADGTGRSQTVDRERNERFHALLSAFGERTGCPVLLNTSFNEGDEPLVCTPADAIRALQALDIDALVMGDWIMRRVVARDGDGVGAASGQVESDRRPVAVG